MRVSGVSKCSKNPLSDAKYDLHFLLIFSCSGIMLCSQEVIMTSEDGFRGVKSSKLTLLVKRDWGLYVIFFCVNGFRRVSESAPVGEVRLAMFPPSLALGVLVTTEMVYIEKYSKEMVLDHTAWYLYAWWIILVSGLSARNSFPL